MADNPTRRPKSEGGNLRTMTPEEARYYGAMGGRKSAENRRRKKALREQAFDLLNAELTDKQIATLRKSFGQGIDPSDKSFFAVLFMAMCAQGLKGNVQAYRAVMDTVADQSSDQTNAFLEAFKKIGIAGEDASKD